MAGPTKAELARQLAAVSEQAEREAARARRLFTELEARNADLTESLDRQTATAEILRVISGSRTDVQPVFDTIVRSAVRLCGALSGVIWRAESGCQRVMSFAASTSPNGRRAFGTSRLPAGPGPCPGGLCPTESSFTCPTSSRTSGSQAREK